ncbi:hypothetical protein LMH87_002158 [Akanthomyces muscarius]|uniref:Uncharacterized protein n=1 Tax=Akanthomyces muscarius TaxID=2231603 RepID=A0A9W8Q7Y4_AKAMU|nr:hypothetical protein LMH87_002158 [Akanthomyces muscarius]KAJ4147648.1 hypothetical protein LMH87_002158 [Akanthomyces muscarius]
MHQCKPSRKDMLLCGIGTLRGSWQCFSSLPCRYLLDITKQCGTIPRDLAAQCRQPPVLQNKMKKLPGRLQHAKAALGDRPAAPERVWACWSGFWH